jgi:hypothetical protein
MKEKYLYLTCALAIIFLLFTAGCITPPQENATKVSGKTNTTNVKMTTVQHTYVTEVTLSDYAQSTLGSSGYTTFLPTTQIPTDMTCLIHSINLFGYNGTAFIFNLKNPPMFINYTVVPRNITKSDVYTVRSGTYVPTTTVGEGYIPKSGKGSMKTVTYSDYSPTSWFEITVRDNATNEIILQDGFGETKGYSSYLTRTLKILKTGDVLVEFRGNDIKKASASVWVKPLENFDESRLSEFTNCMYWEGHRDTVAMPVTTLWKATQGTTVPQNVFDYAWGDSKNASSN